jgi:hypothetical protein
MRIRRENENQSDEQRDAQPEFQRSVRQGNVPTIAWRQSGCRRPLQKPHFQCLSPQSSHDGLFRLAITLENRRFHVHVEQTLLCYIGVAELPLD